MTSSAGGGALHFNTGVSGCHLSKDFKKVKGEP